MSTDIFGQDIALDDDMQPLIAANGELILTSGPDTGVQDIKLRITTYIGMLFYDKDYGSTARDWVMDESTETNRIGFAAEIKRCVHEDPRVQPSTVTSAVTFWDETSILCEVSWNFINEDHAYNLVIEVDRSKKEMVIKDVNPQAL